MANVGHVADCATKWIRWLARIWGTVIVVVVLFIVVGHAWNWVTTGRVDPYAAEDYPPIENLPPLLVCLSAVGLGLAWRWEEWGGGMAVVLQLANLAVLLIHWPIAQVATEPGFAAPYLVWVAVAAPGVLFLICWRRSARARSARTLA